jgi:hypothetical protein
MKKYFSLLMAIIVMVSALGFSVTKASAAGEYFNYVGVEGNAFIFDATHGGDLNGASIFVGSEYHKLYCVFKKEENKIVCDAGSVITKYAGQWGTIYLAGQLFWVKIPEKHFNEEVSNIPVCTSPDVLGAMVLFTTLSDGNFTYFIAGDTLQDVANNAGDWVGGFYLNFSLQGGLECGQEPS